MKVILKEDIIGLGYKNEVVEVKAGYGRNYLIPQQKAVMATKSALKVLAENLRQQAHKIDVLKAAAQKRANALEGVVVEVAAKVASSGQLYGSVNAATVAEELAKKGIEVDRKIITMRDIKQVGQFEALVHFFKDVEVRVPVVVVAENAPEKAPVEEAPKAEEAPEVEETTEVEEAPAAE